MDGSEGTDTHIYVNIDTNSTTSTDIMNVDLNIDIKICINFMIKIHTKPQPQNSESRSATDQHLGGAILRRPGSCGRALGEGWVAVKELRLDHHIITKQPYGFVCNLILALSS